MNSVTNSSTLVVSLIKGTCSYRASKEYCTVHGIPQKNIKQVNSFYEGKSYLATKPVENKILLVPHVHELSGALTMHPDFRIIDEHVFSLVNPELILAKSDTALPSREKKCATINALRTLLINDESHFPVHFHSAQNTQEAAYLSSIGQCGYCITNEYGMKKYSQELTPIKTLKKLNVFWFPFTYDIKKD